MVDLVWGAWGLRRAGDIHWPESAEMGGSRVSVVNTVGSLLE